MLPMTESRSRRHDFLKRFIGAGTAGALGIAALSGCGPAASADRPPAATASPVPGEATPAETTPSQSETQSTPETVDLSKFSQDPKTTEYYQNLSPEDKAFYEENEEIDEDSAAAPMFTRVKTSTLTIGMFAEMAGWGVDAIAPSIEEVEADPSKAVDSVQGRLDIASALMRVAASMMQQRGQTDVEASGNEDVARVVDAAQHILLGLASHWRSAAEADRIREDADILAIGDVINTDILDVYSSVTDPSFSGEGTRLPAIDTTNPDTYELDVDPAAYYWGDIHELNDEGHKTRTLLYNVGEDGKWHGMSGINLNSFTPQENEVGEDVWFIANVSKDPIGLDNPYIKDE